MELWSISEVARQVGLRPSAIRYYEQLGVLPPAERRSGQRRYDTAVLHRLAVIQRARQTGFTLEEIRHLFVGFRDGTPASKRWQELSEKKLAELAVMAEQIRTMQRLLRIMNENCSCDTLDECGKRMLRRGRTPDVAKTQPRKAPRR
jgi:MerR family redox-sensitive transcriptional activator SoxR